MLGFSSSIFYYAIAAAFVLGAYLIEKQLFDLNFEKIMRVFSVLIFGAQSVGKSKFSLNRKLKINDLKFSF